MSAAFTAFGEADTCENVQLSPCSTEVELLEAFRDFVVKEDADIITGWNVHGFDWKYMQHRLWVCHGHGVKSAAENPPKIPSRYEYWSRLPLQNCTYKEEVSNDPRRPGDVGYFRKCFGRVSVDYMSWCMRYYRFRSYALRAVAEECKLPAKLDMSPQRMFAAWRAQDPKELCSMLAYCIRDCDVPLAIGEHKQFVGAILNLSAACYTYARELVNGGQLARTTALVAVFCRSMNPPFVVGGEKHAPENIGLQGGAVLEPIPSGRDPVVCIDFASLYPSIIRAFHLCPSAVVKPEDRHLFPKERLLQHEDHVALKHGGSVVP